MTSTRRKSSSEFSSSVEETTDTVKETPAEAVEVFEEEEKEETVIETKEPSPVSVTSVRNNPKPVTSKQPPRRNTPRFSSHR